MLGSREAFPTAWEVTRMRFNELQLWGRPWGCLRRRSSGRSRGHCSFLIQCWLIYFFSLGSYLQDST